MVGLGVTPNGAFRLVITVAARTLGLEDGLERLYPGFAPDVIAVQRDPSRTSG